MGFCGSVWASDLVYAFKRQDGAPGRDLFNDYTIHRKLLENIPGSESNSSQTIARIPGCHQYVRRSAYTCSDAPVSEFLKEFQPCNVLVTDRIPPLPQEIRNLIIDRYCPKPLISLIKSSKLDQDCLIRPYLGRRRRLFKQSKFQAFSLRNYPLHLDQIEEFALDGFLYARIMAETLAHMYWRAHVDANDVEFVLAPPRSTLGATIKSQALGEHVVWMLDFDCCRNMPFDEIGVEQAVNAFYNNDPFYPRPGRDDIRDQALWNEFRARFLQVSEDIVGRESPEAHLPTLWVNKVEERGRSRHICSFDDE